MTVIFGTALSGPLPRTSWDPAPAVAFLLTPARQQEGDPERGAGGIVMPCPDLLTLFVSTLQYFIVLAGMRFARLPGSPWRAGWVAAAL